MLEIVEASDELLEHKIRIINSDSFFNRVSKDKDTFTTEEILAEIKEANDIGAARFMIKDGPEYVGLLEYLHRNPSDGYTWLGLLVIEKKHQSKGYGYQALQLFYEMMKEIGVTCFRIGVIKDNEPGKRFWERNGFEYVRTTMNPDKKEFLVYEKTLV